jgi:cytochrome c oxidase assembly factor CtaG
LARSARPGRDRRFLAAQAWWFYSSLVIFYLAVGSPLDQIGERFLFSAHMLQHQLLVYPAAILFLLGLPAWMIDPLLAARPCARENSSPTRSSAALIYTARGQGSGTPRGSTTGPAEQSSSTSAST